MISRLAIMKTIKTLRLDLKLSQSKFANYLDIPVANIQKWEQGVSTPPVYVNKLIERVIRLEQEGVSNG